MKKYCLNCMIDKCIIEQLIITLMTQEMRDKVVNTHSSTIRFVPECYRTHKMCDKAFNKSFIALFIFLIDKTSRNVSQNYF